VRELPIHLNSLVCAIGKGAYIDTSSYLPPDKFYKKVKSIKTPVQRLEGRRSDPGLVTKFRSMAPE